MAGREETWVRWFYENYGHHPRVIDEESVAEYLRTYTQPGALRAVFGYYRAVPQDIEDNQKLEKLTIPVLGIGGGTSFGRGSEVEESLRRMASDDQALVFDDCGHWVPEEKADELPGAMIDFLS